ncbi:conserved hypothetical protein [Desulfarculus baarsii DSM 2075]|uniref:Uncharacterized protein n=1 Tax=Desulfarculus baarsii (strain ATCC 33931 / DSM 2075 / LMG 7858 / VKM B-1802 / 2st14) TaxID=644282 RepID=E1QJG0_DESB2|nr:DVU0524 family FlgM-associated protein [Desulfarculus baarsii]ADK85703.1 conserved hypothetical protein [Desulfarculus baarsii DSM 2075]
MTITSYQVQNILRTYARQLSRGQRLARARSSAEENLADRVNLSIEARRKQVIEKITSEIVANIGSRAPGLKESWGGVEDAALARLSTEYGQKLAIRQDEHSGRLMFNVVDEQSGEVLRSLGAEESAGLQQRLYRITQEVIDENMLS